MLDVVREIDLNHRYNIVGLGRNIIKIFKGFSKWINFWKKKKTAFKLIHSFSRSQASLIFTVYEHRKALLIE